MISNLETEETLRRELCTEGIAVDVDRRLYAEAVSCFPISGVNYQTANLNGECIKIVCAFTLSALRDESRCFSFNQKILDRMNIAGTRTRKRLVSYLHQSPFFKVVTEHSKGHHSKIRQICGVRLDPSDAHQHNTVRGGRPWGGGRGLEYGSGGLRRMPCCWRFSKETCPVVLSVDWFREYGESFRSACRRLYAREWAFVSCLEKAVSMCQIGLPSFESCMSLVCQKVAYSGSDPFGNTKLRRLAECWQSMWADWHRDPLLYMFRAKGRLYYPLVSQPKMLRQRYLKFETESGLEDTAEIDLASTYWVLLAAKLRDSKSRNALIEALEAGTFYQQLNEGLRKPFEDRRELKAAVQKDCLFGRRDFGRTELFGAMEGLFPSLARYILSLRKHRKIPGLSTMLMSQEAAFFIEQVLPCLADAGVPALPIHDAVLVPASRADEVFGRCQELAKQQFGFQPCFKISRALLS